MRATTAIDVKRFSINVGRRVGTSTKKIRNNFRVWGMILREDRGDAFVNAWKLINVTDTKVNS